MVYVYIINNIEIAFVARDFLIISGQRTDRPKHTFLFLLERFMITNTHTHVNVSNTLFVRQMHIVFPDSRIRKTRLPHQ